MSRFFVEPHQVDEKTIDITNKEDINHLKRALRHKVGDELEVSDGNKWEYICRIENIEDERVILSIIHKQPFSRESRFEVTLFQGMPKSGKMDLIIQKAVELGATRIQPVYMSRTIVVDKGKDDKKQMRWQKISDEAAKQCKRGKLPDVGLPINFKDAVKDLQAFDYVIFPYENEGKTTMKDALLDIEMTSKGRNIAVIIGPEGGFSDEEAKALCDIGAYVVSLGGSILRTETAALTALAMIRYQLEL